MSSNKNLYRNTNTNRAQSNSRTAVVSKPSVGRGRGISKASVPKPINLPSHASSQQQQVSSEPTTQTQTQQAPATTGAWGSKVNKEETAPKQAWTQQSTAPQTVEESKPTKKKLDWSSLVDDEEEDSNKKQESTTSTTAPVQQDHEEAPPKQQFGFSGVPKIKQREIAPQPQQSEVMIKKRPISASSVQTKPAESSEDLEHLKNQQVIMSSYAEEKRKRLEAEREREEKERKERAEAKLKALEERLQKKKQEEQERAKELQKQQAEQKQQEQQPPAKEEVTKEPANDDHSHTYHSRGRGNQNARGGNRGRGRGGRGRVKPTYRLVNDRNQTVDEENVPQQQVEQPVSEQKPQETSNIAPLNFEKVDLIHRRRKSIEDEQPSTPPPTPSTKPADMAILDIDESGIVRNNIEEAPKISFGTLDSSVEEETKPEPPKPAEPVQSQHPVDVKKPVTNVMPPLPHHSVPPPVMYPPYHPDMYQWPYPVMFPNQMVYYPQQYEPYYPATKIAHLPHSRPPTDTRYPKSVQEPVYIPPAVPPQHGDIRAKPSPVPYHQKPKKNQQQAAAPQEKMENQPQDNSQTEYVRSHNRGGYRGGKQHHHSRGKKVVRKYVPANTSEQGNTAE